jgi:hypothetical protein
VVRAGDIAAAAVNAFFPIQYYHVFTLLQSTIAASFNALSIFALLANVRAKSRHILAKYPYERTRGGELSCLYVGAHHLARLAVDTLLRVNLYVHDPIKTFTYLLFIGKDINQKSLTIIRVYGLPIF